MEPQHGRLDTWLQTKKWEPLSVSVSTSLFTSSYNDPFKIPCEQSENVERSRVNEVSGPNLSLLDLLVAVTVVVANKEL